MTSPQLLHAAIRSDGEVRQAPYTLLCMVAAVKKVSALIEGDVMELYLNEMDVSPLERVLHSADEFSLQKNATRDKYKLKRKLKAQEDEAPPQASSVHLQTDLERLLRSTSRVETRKRLEEQLESLRYEQIRKFTGVSLPKHLQITKLVEDPLEFRRDIRGIAQVWGTLVLLSNLTDR
ncbi:hypothetical protein PHMEG_00029061 [Phytophthora megakarya]|uniref:Uncharacterized protein n=1 Tax=Phytophthora megakarya TaxID=4795 RepID=A0A225V458_9STRA|nr:hypothetical protein PHMEG_00029061 [Phytophthora megakarya]